MSSSRGTLLRVADRQERRANWMLAPGAVLLVVGIVAAVMFAKMTGPPKCAGEVMRPGDTCVTMPSGDVATYKQIAAAHSGPHPVLIGMIVAGAVGLVLLALALFLSRASAVKIRRALDVKKHIWINTRSYVAELDAELRKGTDDAETLRLAVKLAPVMKEHPETYAQACERVGLDPVAFRHQLADRVAAMER